MFVALKFMLMSLQHNMSKTIKTRSIFIIIIIVCEMLIECLLNTIYAIISMLYVL